jgi:acyl transferase domain-containing protein/NAD(P)-dependent dehydrogenase (short-subunit alcohol dehydrogenase family)/NAD(P)H-dependent flavin oxidoreductase YrpB (nitropropane dioxygenase family)
MQPELPASYWDLQEILKTLIRKSCPKDEAITIWREAVRERVGWDRPERNIYIFGQDISFASKLSKRFKTVGGILEGIRQSIEAHLRSTIVQKPFKEGSLLARSHDTKYPIVQGPMTRVSDRPAFALKVAEAGALPILAMGLQRAKTLKALLKETKQLLGDHRWGVGTLGFAPPALGREQFETICNYRPAFAIIAGGRPDQARMFEKEGIHTYLHVPSPGLLKLYLKDGIRRFIFEGHECGGHVGPRTSFVLWNDMFDVLLDYLPENEVTQCHILFAGGIHDTLSSSMVATIAAPLAERGVRVGVLMGTAYLFTTEAVDTGAIVTGFQKVAVQCRQTTLLESGPGHAVRCAITPYTEEFWKKEQQLREEKKSGEEIRNELEAFNLGRLRICAKGVKRHTRYGKDPQAPKFEHVDEKKQRNLGLYMIGQLAALRDETSTMENLHREISVQDSRRLVKLEKTWMLIDRPTLRREKPCDVAIIGMGCIMPKASDLNTYWENILNKVDAITEIPANRWDWRSYYDPNPNIQDKIYSKWGGFLDPIRFDPLRYGMPPNSLSSIEPLQLLTLEAVRAALDDAGYADRDFNREHTSVILGLSGGNADLGQLYAFRSNLPLFVKDASEDILSQLPEWTEDSFAGILQNVAAGRIANRFDLGGVNFTVDAACASSLAAAYLGVRELENKTSDMVIVGGADTIQNPFGYFCFCKTQALSPRGRCRTFDQSADGTCISEGIAIVVLKRLADAERDGDRIYCVIKGIGASSDGRDKGLTAPRPEGQARALNRAYEKSGVSPASLGLIEAHGTGTVAGDRAEIETLNRVFGTAGAVPDSCALGSVKSMIGHTKSTAGLAGLTKTALALYHKALPPTMGVSKPNSALAESPFYVNSDARPWIGTSNGLPRRAGVSAYGFGGTNFHAVLEEYTGNFLETTSQAIYDQWESELLLLTGNSRKELLESIESIEQLLAEGGKPKLRDLAYSLWKNVKRESGYRLAVVVSSLEDLGNKLASTRKIFADTTGSEPIGLHDPKGIYFTETPLGREGKIVFLFPGQGSQYPDMLSEMSIQFHEIRNQFELANRVLADRFSNPLSAYVFPPTRFNKEDEQRRKTELAQTNVAQPALGAADMGLFYLMKAFDIEPDMVAGHSYGEYVALCAAGVFSDEILYLLSEARGRFIIEAAKQDLGTMAAVEAGNVTITEIIRAIDSVWIANLNSPRQTIISGTKKGVEETIENCKAQGIGAVPIEISCAFHSPIVEPAKDRLAEFISTFRFSKPRLKVFSNSTAAPYPQSPKSIAARLSDHLVRPVKFQKQIEAMYQSGARIFVEIGPRNVLTNLTGQILADQPHLAVALDTPGRSGLFQLQNALGQMAAQGLPINLDRLYHGRNVREINLDQVVEETKRQQACPPTTWLVDGGRAQPIQNSLDSRAAMKSPRPKKDEKVQITAASKLPGKPTTVSNKEEGRPAPQISASASSSSRITAVSDQSLPDSEVGSVMIRFQELMNKFLETQRQVMLAYLNGSSEEAAFSGEISTLEEKLGNLTAPASASLPSGLENPMSNPPPETSSSQHEPSVIPDLSTQAAPTETSALREELPAIDKEQLTAKLLQIVSDRTGYPPEMLELDLNLEADLGIDSIKRVEILTTLQQDAIPLDQVEAQAAMEELTKAKTLREIIDWISKAFRLQPEDQTQQIIHRQPKIAVSQTSAEELEDREVEVPRFILTAVETAIPDQTLQIPSASVFLITDDEKGIAQVLADEIRRSGGCAALVRQGDDLQKNGKDTYAANLADPKAVTRLADLIREEHGPLNGIIHILPLKDGPSFEELNLEAWKRRTGIEVKGLFYLAKEFGDDLKQAAESKRAWLISATAMGGIFASDPDNKQCIFPTHGGVAGIVKTLALELPAVHCKVVDFDLGDRARTVAGHFFCEMRSEDEEVEVGYMDSRRFVLRLRPAPLDTGSLPKGLNIDAKSVILLTGGARGITAEVACEFAKRYQPTILLAGRSPLPPDQEPPETVELSSPKDIKAALIDQIHKAGTEANLAQVEATYKQLCRDREMRGNLLAMQEAGAKVQYYQVDVRDEQAFADLLEEIYQTYGRLDGVINGAGVIEDKLYQEKSAQSFDRVFDTKADSAFLLAHNVRADSLKFLVFFSSVVGRFGNPGQSDYAAANEVLNKLGVYLDRRWPGRVLSINWGPWAKSGMVSAVIERQFLKRGWQMIPPSEGCRILDQEIIYGQKGQAEVLFGNGAWETALPALSISTNNTFPLLNGISNKSMEDGTVKIIRNLDPDHDIYLKDHQLDGKCVFPVAMAMELVAEVVQQGWPELKVVGIRDIKVFKGIIIGNEPRKICIAASSPRNTSSDNSILEVDVEITELGRNERPCYRALVQLGKIFPSPIPYNVDKLSKLPPFPLTVDEAYQRWLFHGPCFRGISTIEGMNEKGICALLLPSSPAKCLLSKPGGQWLIDPIVVDSAFQLAIIWERAHFDMTPLPSVIKSCRRFGPAPASPVRCYYEAKPLFNGHKLLNTFYFLNENENVLNYFIEMEASCSKELNRLSYSHRQGKEMINE